MKFIYVKNWSCSLFFTIIPNNDFTTTLILLMPARAYIDQFYKGNRKSQCPFTGEQSLWATHVVILWPLKDRIWCDNICLQGLFTSLPWKLQGNDNKITEPWTSRCRKGKWQVLAVPLAAPTRMLLSCSPSHNHQTQKSAIWTEVLTGNGGNIRHKDKWPKIQLLLNSWQKLQIH